MGWFGRKKAPRDANEMLREYNEEQTIRIAEMMRGESPAASSSDIATREASVSTAGAGGIAEFTVEDVFTITGRGLVATGAARIGTLRVGDGLVLLRGGEEKGTARITGIEMFRKKATQVEAGSTAGLLLKGVAGVTRGDVLRVAPAAGA